MGRNDELTGAVARVWNPRLRSKGFRRVGKRDLAAVRCGIVLLFNFQVSAWGSRDFCVNVAAFTLSGNHLPVLQPGFCLETPVGGQLWLPSRTAAEATNSVETAWSLALKQALPWLDKNSTLEGHLKTLNSEKWGSRHHQLFKIGVVEALLGRNGDSADHLREAISLYLDDGRDWCRAEIAKAEALLDALRQDNAVSLLDKWASSNRLVHRLK
jgi:hypothetical protein